MLLFQNLSRLIISRLSSDYSSSIKSTCVQLPLFTEKQRRIKCYRCGIVGHIRRNCRVNLCKPGFWKSSKTCDLNGDAKSIRYPKSFHTPILTGSSSDTHYRASTVRNPKRVDICASSAKGSYSRSGKVSSSLSVAPVENLLEGSTD